jgi:hypothetical protein
VWKCTNVQGPDSLQDVLIQSASEDESDAISRSTRVKPKPSQRSKASTLKAKQEPGSKLHLVASDSSAANRSSVHSTGSSDFNPLPEFARGAWSSSFLPTLVDRLGQSPDPFVIEADMVKVIQDIVDLVYPGVDYQVRANDYIFNMVIVHLLPYLSRD